MPQYLLLQARDSHDPMKPQEVRCFARTLNTELSRIRTFCLLSDPLGHDLLSSAECLLIGGSGDYSVTDHGAWLTRALDSVRRALDSGLPMFASCWGFQAIALALGGQVEKDQQRAEIGSIPVSVTEEGSQDPLLSPLAPRFKAQMGHEDHVTELPPGAIHLARTEAVPYQAYRLPDQPVYCTQFHPELNRDSILDRLRAYPQYARDVLGESMEQATLRFAETPESSALLPRFVQMFVTDRNQESPCTSPS